MSTELHRIRKEAISRMADAVIYKRAYGDTNDGMGYVKSTTPPKQKPTEQFGQVTTSIQQPLVQVPGLQKKTRQAGKNRTNSASSGISLNKSATSWYATPTTFAYPGQHPAQFKERIDRDGPGKVFKEELGNAAAYAGGYIGGASMLSTAPTAAAAEATANIPAIGRLLSGASTAVTAHGLSKAVPRLANAAVSGDDKEMTSAIGNMATSVIPIGRAIDLSARVGVHGGFLGWQLGNKAYKFLNPYMSRMLAR